METVRIVRNVLLRSFVIGVVIGLLMGITTLAGWDTWMSLTSRLFHVDVAIVSQSVLSFFLGLRFFFWFGLLTPALALHWTLRVEAKKTS